MTLETALFSALSTVSTVLLWMARAFYFRLLAAEKRIEILHDEIASLTSENATHKAELGMFQRCPKKDCPFQINRSVTA